MQQCFPSVLEIVRLPTKTWALPVILQRLEQVRDHPECVLGLCSSVLSPLTAHLTCGEKGASLFPCGRFALLMSPVLSEEGTFRHAPTNVSSTVPCRSSSNLVKCSMTPSSGNDFNGFFWVIQSFTSAQTFRILSFLSGSNWVCEGPSYALWGLPGHALAGVI